MKKKYTRSLFVFRQDLRVSDNSGLYYAISNSDQVVLLFVFDPTILESFAANDSRMGFLLESLKELQKKCLKLGGDLIVQYGESITTIQKTIKTYQCDAIFRNKSYGENSKKRDFEMQVRADSQGITSKACNDYLLVEPKDVDQRKVFTPFYKLRMGVPKRFSLLPNITNISIPPLSTVTNWNDLEKKLSWKPNTHWPIQKRNGNLKDFNRHGYEETRNFPANNTGTTQLSPYLRFGLVSIRTVLRHAIQELNPKRVENEEIIADSTLGIYLHKKDQTITMDRKVFKNAYISELAWREFRQHINAYFPETTHTEFQEKRRGLNRNSNEKRLQARKDGKTGYPIVDAAMIQLQKQKWMHGRCRMIVASFLTKDLLIDRREGEKHFKEHLLDYDRNINIGNRQRSASVGPDPKPLRIFNPILQSKRFDPQCEYILKRLPELQGEDIRAIHDPIKYDLEYISPIVDHYVTSKEAKKMYYKDEYNV